MRILDSNFPKGLESVCYSVSSGCRLWQEREVPGSEDEQDEPAGQAEEGRSDEVQEMGA